MTKKESASALETQWVKFEGRQLGAIGKWYSIVIEIKVPVTEYHIKVDDVIAAIHVAGYQLRHIIAFNQNKELLP